MSDSPELVDFAIGLVNSVPNLPDRQVRCQINSAHQKILGVVEMTFG